MKRRLAGGLMLASLLAAPLVAQQAAPVAAGPATGADVAAKAPPAPDYGLPASWSVFAGKGFASAPPQGAAPAARAPGVAVFFLQPTTYRGSKGEFTQDVGDAEAAKWADESAIARQASAFAACCDVYAPRYRAASYASFASTPLREAAFALAYTDVERAFDAFLKAIGNRPFIIAGYSQGAFHAATLLEHRIEGTALQQRMVAAYVIGINLARGDFGRRFKSVQPCASPAQTGCVVQWNSYLDGIADVGRLAGLSEAGYVRKYGDEAGRETLCVNPLTFAADQPTAPASAAKGAVGGTPGLGPMRPLQAHAVAARCEHGLLLVTPDTALELVPLPGGVMHYHDIGLFWADLSANAVLRSRAFTGQHK